MKKMIAYLRQMYSIFNLDNLELANTKKYEENLRVLKVVTEDIVVDLEVVIPLRAGGSKAQELQQLVQQLKRELVTYMRRLRTRVREIREVQGVKQKAIVNCIFKENATSSHAENKSQEPFTEIQKIPQEQEGLLERGTEYIISDNADSDSVSEIDIVSDSEIEIVSDSAVDSVSVGVSDNVSDSEVEIVSDSESVS